MEMAPVSPAATDSHVNVHFLHIGKTGGTAIKDMLLPCFKEHRWLVRHGHRFSIDDVPEGEKFFFFLRDPVSRYVSGFNTRLRQGKPKFNNPWSREEAAAFAHFKTANELALALEDESKQTRRRANRAMRNIVHVCTSYWDWLSSPERLRARAQDVFFIGQQEHFDGDARQLVKLLGFEGIEPVSDETRSQKTPDGMHRDLDPQAYEIIRKHYETDYEAIALCREIARDRGFGGSLAG